MELGFYLALSVFLATASSESNTTDSIEDDQCQTLNSCVQCQVHQTGPLVEGDGCVNDCHNFLAIPVDTINEYDHAGQMFCETYDEHNCKIAFAYQNEPDNKVTIHAQRERECPSSVDGSTGIWIWVVAIIVIACVICAIVAVTRYMQRRRGTRNAMAAAKTRVRESQVVYTGVPTKGTDHVVDVNEDNEDLKHSSGIDDTVVTEAKNLQPQLLHQSQPQVSSEVPEEGIDDTAVPAAKNLEPQSQSQPQVSIEVSKDEIGSEKSESTVTPEPTVEVVVENQDSSSSDSSESPELKHK